MSGGHFDYQQYHIGYIADEVKQILEDAVNGKNPDWLDFTKIEIYQKIKEGWNLLKIAEIFAQRIDWLVSGDDDEESFIRRLKEDLDSVEPEKEQVEKLLPKINERLETKKQKKS